MRERRADGLWSLRGRKRKRDCTQLPRGQIGLGSGVDTTQCQNLPPSKPAQGQQNLAAHWTFDRLRVSEESFRRMLFQKQALTNHGCSQPSWR